ncbi:MAG: GNAT family N-acetyltransferase [Nitrososphaerota archaeon]|nr:GNAT family N-acetyltransferase [Nitrososphaerota archaeon]MDG6978201.1 GNAT family N-acetyltransferase [Nitrososphaerota archaeon]MDG7006365.1 GNAT family N-acetyltransferase [Nitrososphaerota archaeon]MDG7020498.1 GNAT family N-acetyltransferase [Nitrososphaerota archaeon]MDG7021933.1 GNAT family N-acetyltransferase [Nitrososphaerota archaeon]
MPSGRFLLRACAIGDLDGVVKLEKASFPERPYGRLDFAYYLLTSRRGFLVAEREGRVVGYVIAASGGSECSIQSIAVAPGSRRMGVGEALLRSAMAALPPRVKRVRLLVDVENEGAMGLYRKLFFEETGRVEERYYPNGNDAKEMAREV